MSRFSRLFGRLAGTEDPVEARLKVVPVPQSLAGTFAEGLRSERDLFHRTKGADPVEVYTLHWNRPPDEITARIRARDTTPLVLSVEQKIALSRNAELAHWWFFTMTEGFKQNDGRESGKRRYGQLKAESPDLGDEADLMSLSHVETHPFGESTTHHETFVNVRVDRMVATVRTSAVFGDPRIERQVEALAQLLARRIQEALRAAA